MLILKSSGITLVVGLLFYFTSPTQWKSSITIMPELANDATQLGGDLSGLAGLAGIDLNLNASGDLNPQVYPEILNSNSFLLSFLEQEYRFAQIDEKVSLLVYLNEHRKRGVLESLLHMVKKVKNSVLGSQELENLNNHKLLTFDEYHFDAMEQLRGMVYLNLDMETGIVSIECKSQDPEVSALMVEYIYDYFTAFITTYRIQKEENKLLFIEGQFAESKVALDKALKDLSDYLDKNLSLRSEKSKIELKQLQSEYDIAFNLYSLLAKQYEETKIRVKEKTPVFKVLSPISVPVEKDSISIITAFFSSIFLGMLVGISIIVIPEIL